MEHIACPVCHRKQSELRFVKNGFTIYRCTGCTVEFVFPFPEDRLIGEVYNNSGYHAEDRYQPGTSSRQSRIWKERLETIQKLAPEKKTLLDVGCATGIFLREAQKNRWEVEGLEISAPAARIAAQLVGTERIHTMDLMRFQAAKKYACVTLWALIEHVKNPAEYLNKANRLLIEGGCLALSTPNTDALSRRWLGNAWRYYIPPEHLIYFNRQSLSLLLEQAGFTVVEVRTHSNLQAYFRRNSPLLQWYSKNLAVRIMIKALLSPILLINRSKHLGETLEIYARKASESAGKQNQK